MFWLDDGTEMELEELLEEGPVLLLFYPFDWSTTCRQELRLLHDRLPEFRRAGVRAFGVSRDSYWSHRTWKESLGVDVPLLSDWNGSLTKHFDVARVWRRMEDVPRRSGFLVGEDGTVLGSWPYEDSEVPDFDELLEAARALSG